MLDDGEVAEPGADVGRDAERPLVLELAFAIRDREAVKGSRAGGAGIARGRERHEDRTVGRTTFSGVYQAVTVRVGGQRRALAYGLREPVDVLEMPQTRREALTLYLGLQKPVLQL